MSSFTLLLIFTLTIIHQTFADDVITCTFSATKNHDFGGTLTLSKNVDGNLAVTGKVSNNANGNWKPNQNHSIALFKNPTDDNQDCSIIGDKLNVVAVASTNGTGDNSTVAAVDNNDAGDWVALTDSNGDLPVNIVDHFAFTLAGFSEASDFCNHTIAIFNGTDDAASSVIVACCTVAKAVAAAPTEAVVLTGVVYETQNQYNHWQNQYGYPWGWNPPYGCAAPSWWNYSLYYTTTTTVKTTTSQYYGWYTSTAKPTAAPTPPVQYDAYGNPIYPAGYYTYPTTTTAKPTTVTTYAYINCYYTCDTYPYETCQQVSAPTCVPSYYVKCSAPNQAVLAALAVLVGLFALFL